MFRRHLLTSDIFMLSLKDNQGGEKEYHRFVIMYENNLNNQNNTTNTATSHTLKLASHNTNNKTKSFLLLICSILGSVIKLKLISIY